MARGKVKAAEEKLKIVTECLNGEISIRKCARKYGIDNNSLLRWIRLYKAHGIDGLAPYERAKTHSVEVKIQTVTECLDGETSVRQCARKYGIGETTIWDWIHRYEARGIEGLTAPTRRRKYPIELKTQAVKDYLSGAKSLHSICKKYDISSNSLLQKWIKCYNSHETFKQPNKGGIVSMAKGRNTTLEERIEIVSHCIAGNMNYGETIEQYGVSYNQIFGWVKKYEKSGTDGLIDRRGKRKEENSMTEVEKLRAELKLKEAENYRLQMENDLLKKLEEIERRRGQD